MYPINNRKMMAKKSERNIITGLDIGTSKIIALVGEVAPSGEIELIGVGRHLSLGLKRGVVVDIELTVQAIQRAVQEAELMAGCEVASVGCDVISSAIAMNKEMTKVIMQGSENFKMARYKVLYWYENAAHLQDFCTQVVSDFGFPVFVKPNSLGSSVGINKARNLQE